jgi:hypothetical protein
MAASKEITNPIPALIFCAMFVGICKLIAYIGNFF